MTNTHFFRLLVDDIDYYTLFSKLQRLPFFVFYPGRPSIRWYCSTRGITSSKREFVIASPNTAKNIVEGLLSSPAINASVGANHRNPGTSSIEHNGYAVTVSTDGQLVSIDFEM